MFPHKSHGLSLFTLCSKILPICRYSNGHTHVSMLQVHMPILEPSTLLQLALFKETGPRGSRKSVLVGLLRLRLNSLTSEVDHSAELPMCSSRKQGGEKTATIGLNVKVSRCTIHLRAAVPHQCSVCALARVADTRTLYLAEATSARAGSRSHRQIWQLRQAVGPGHSTQRPKLAHTQLDSLVVACRCPTSASGAC